MLTGTFGAGWVGQIYVGTDRATAGANAVSESKRLILPVGRADEGRFTAVLERLNRLLSTYANAGGLDLVRTAVSHHIERIRALISRYDNVHFIACSKGLERLRRQGKNVQLIDSVQADEPAADHLIQRLTEGWNADPYMTA